LTSAIFQEQMNKTISAFYVHNQQIENFNYENTISAQRLHYRKIKPDMDYTFLEDDLNGLGQKG